MNISETCRDGKVIRVYDCGHTAPVVYDNEYMENGQAILEKCAQIGCPEFHLVTVSGINWDSDLSPWPSEPVVSAQDHFTGEADGYLKWLQAEVIVPAEKSLAGRCTERVLAGYSMAGMFALYAACQTDLFDCIVSASGSVWYPGFEEYCRTHDPVKKPSAIYLSLGNRETRTRNRYMKTTETVCRNLQELYLQQGIRTTFELNEGNHFREPDLRLARGISFVLHEE